MPALVSASNAGPGGVYVTIRRRDPKARRFKWMSYIGANDVLAMMAIVLVMVWLGFLTDAARLGKVVPGVVVVLSLGTLLSNLHVTAFSSGVADFIGQYVVAAAIPLLMIKADLRKIFIESGKVMLGFGAACVGVVIGVLIGYYLLQPWHVSANVAGVYAGGFIGGTISLVAVANAVGMSATDLSVATGASMIPSVLGLMTLVSLPTSRIVQKMFPQKLAAEKPGSAADAAALTAAPEFRLTHVSGALAMSMSICALARLVADVVGQWTHHDQGQYRILYVTVLTVVAANLFPKQLRRLRGEFELGMIFMYLFFAMIGLGTDITTFLNNAVSLFFYVIIFLVIGISITLVLCKFLRLNMAETITGCGAAIVGPAATVAVVAGKGWHAMITPAVMTGILCHVVGNFVGIAVATLLR
jgi:uncharacterized membrane protein